MTTMSNEEKEKLQEMKVFLIAAEEYLKAITNVYNQGLNNRDESFLRDFLDCYNEMEDVVESYENAEHQSERVGIAMLWDILEKRMDYLIETLMVMNVQIGLIPVEIIKETFGNDHVKLTRLLKRIGG